MADKGPMRWLSGKDLGSIPGTAKEKSQLESKGAAQLHIFSFLYETRKIFLGTFLEVGRGMGYTQWCLGLTPSSVFRDVSWMDSRDHKAVLGTKTKVRVIQGKLFNLCTSKRHILIHAVSSVSTMI